MGKYGKDLGNIYHEMSGNGWQVRDFPWISHARLRDWRLFLRPYFLLGMPRVFCTGETTSETTVLQIENLFAFRLQRLQSAQIESTFRLIRRCDWLTVDAQVRGFAEV
jgi:hypothetical protein